MSTKKKILIIFILACILLIPSTVVLAKKEPVYFEPQSGLDITVTSSDEVVIRSRWFACSKGLVNDYIDSTTLAFYVNDTVLKNTLERNKSYWNVPYEYDGAFPLACLWDVDKVWVAHWEYNLGKLEPGDYQVLTQQPYDFPVVDGFDFAEPIGELDVYDGEDVFGPVTIHVIP